MTTSDTAPSRQVLDEAPTRAIRLLKTLGTNLQIRAVLAARGYVHDDHREGWNLLHAAAGFDAHATAAPSAALASALDETVRSAITELDATDEPFLRILRASLGRRFPAQASFVLDGVEAAQGAGAVLVIATLLDRLESLATDPARKKSRPDDRKALDLVAQRGYGPDRLKALRVLVKQAQSSPESLPSYPPASMSADDPGRTAALVALHAWWKEWSEIARAVIRRRDHLIALGLARRTARKPEAAPTPG